MLPSIVTLLPAYWPSITMPWLRRPAWFRLTFCVAVLAPTAVLPIKAYHHKAPHLNPVVDPINVDHTLGRRLGPSILCNDKAIEPRIELRGEKYWVLLLQRKSTQKVKKLNFYVSISPISRIARGNFSLISLILLKKPCTSSSFTYGIEHPASLPTGFV